MYRSSQSLRRAMTILAIAFAGIAISGIAGSQEPAEVPTSVPSPGTIEIRGVAEERLNPTHGTVFFQVSNAFFPADVRDIAVIVNGRQLPAADLAVSRRIVAARYVIPEGENEIVLRAWDAAGQVLSATTHIWAGDLTIHARVTDFDDRALDDAEVVATLANAPSIRTVARSREGIVEFVNVPSSEVLLTASHPSGLEGETTLAAGQRRALLVLR